MKPNKTWARRIDGSSGGYGGEITLTLYKSSRFLQQGKLVILELHKPLETPPCLIMESIL